MPRRIIGPTLYRKYISGAYTVRNPRADYGGKPTARGNVAMKKQQPAKTSYAVWARARVDKILSARRFSSNATEGVLQIILMNRHRVGRDAEEWKCLLRAFSANPVEMQKLRDEIAARNAHLKEDEDALEAQMQRELDTINQTRPIRLNRSEINQLVAIAIAYLKSREPR